MTTIPTTRRRIDPLSVTTGFERDRDEFTRGARAIVVYPDLGGSSRDAEARLEETAGLAEAIGVLVVDRVALRIRTPDAYETATVHRDLGDLEERAGNPDEARSHREQAIDLYRKANASASADALASGQHSLTSAKASSPGDRPRW